MANGYNHETNKHEDGHHFKLVKNLIDFVNKEKIRIIVNDVIIDEWNRNKEASKNLINQHHRNLEGVNSTLKSIKRRLSHDGVQKVNEIYKEYESIIQNEISKNEEHIQQVEHLLFEKSVKISVSDEVKIQAANLALAKKAPFHKKKNSVADAVILLSAVEYFQESDFEWINNTIFVSNNSDGYCEEKGDKIVHSDLQLFFKKASIIFYNNIAEALNFSQEIIKEIDEYFDYIGGRGECLANCKGIEYGMAKVYFSEERVIELEDSEKYSYDPNQLQIDFNGEYMYTAEERLGLHTSSYIRLLFGSCDFCGTTHIRCDCDNEFFVTDDNFEVECECGKLITSVNDEVKVFQIG